LFHEEKEEEVVGVVVGMEYLVSCRCGDASFSIFSRLGVGGDEYFVYLPDLGMQVFLCFQDDEEVGMQGFQDEEEVQMERLADVGIEEEEEEEEDEEEGNHLTKEPVPYYVNYKKSVP
jgi:hypothetical protein